MASQEPASNLSVQAGTDVVSSDGERIGTVDHVLTDEATGIFDGLIIDVRLGPGGLHFADAPEVAEIHPDRVVLAISAANVEIVSGRG